MLVNDSMAPKTWLARLASNLPRHQTRNQMNESMVLNVVDKAHIKLIFKCMERSMAFEVGAMMRRSDTYLSKVTHKGTGDSRSTPQPPPPTPGPRPQAQGPQPPTLNPEIPKL